MQDLTYLHTSHLFPRRRCVLTCKRYDIKAESSAWPLFPGSLKPAVFWLRNSVAGVLRGTCCLLIRASRLRILTDRRCIYTAAYRKPSVLCDRPLRDSGAPEPSATGGLYSIPFGGRKWWVANPAVVFASSHLDPNLISPSPSQTFRSCPVTNLPGRQSRDIKNRLLPFQ